MAVHIEEITIKNFRGIEDLTLEDCASVNILLGKNNCGKTSVLEAISLYCGGTLDRVFVLARRREKGMSTSSDFRSVLQLFSNTGGELEPIFLEGTSPAGLRESVTLLGELGEEIRTPKTRSNHVYFPVRPTAVLQLTLKNPFRDPKKGVSRKIVHGASRINLPVSSPDCSSQLIGGLESLTYDLTYLMAEYQDEKESFLLIARCFDQDIEDLFVIEDRFGIRNVMVAREDGTPALPISSYGDGLNKALLLTAALLESEDGVLLVDEFETAIHTQGMKKVWLSLLKLAAARKVQLFLSTHSLEAVDKLLSLSDKRLENMSVYRLHRKYGLLDVEYHSGLEARDLREDFNEELRL